MAVLFYFPLYFWLVVLFGCICTSGTPSFGVSVKERAKVFNGGFTRESTTSDNSKRANHDLKPVDISELGSSIQRNNVEDEVAFRKFELKSVAHHVNAKKNPKPFKPKSERNIDKNDSSDSESTSDGKLEKDNKQEITDPISEVRSLGRIQSSLQLHKNKQPSLSPGESTLHNLDSLSSGKSTSRSRESLYPGTSTSHNLDSLSSGKSTSHSRESLFPVASTSHNLDSLSSGKSTSRSRESLFPVASTSHNLDSLSSGKSTSSTDEPLYATVGRKQHNKGKNYPKKSESQGPYSLSPGKSTSHSRESLIPFDLDTDLQSPTKNFGYSASPYPISIILLNALLSSEHVPPFSVSNISDSRCFWKIPQEVIKDLLSSHHTIPLNSNYMTSVNVLYVVTRETPLMVLLSLSSVSMKEERSSAISLNCPTQFPELITFQDFIKKQDGKRISLSSNRFVQYTVDLLLQPNKLSITLAIPGFTKTIFEDDFTMQHEPKKNLKFNNKEYFELSQLYYRDTLYSARTFLRERLAQAVLQDIDPCPPETSVDSGVTNILNVFRKLVFIPDSSTASVSNDEYKKELMKRMRDIEGNILSSSITKNISRADQSPICEKNRGPLIYKSTYKFIDDLIIALKMKKPECCRDAVRKLDKVKEYALWKRLSRFEVKVNFMSSNILETANNLSLTTIYLLPSSKELMLYFCNTSAAEAYARVTAPESVFEYSNFKISPFILPSVKSFKLRNGRLTYTKAGLWQKKRICKFKLALPAESRKEDSKSRWFHMLKRKKPQAEPELPETARAEPEFPETPRVKRKLPETPRGEPKLSETAPAEPKFSETARAELEFPETPRDKRKLLETPRVKRKLPETPRAEPKLSETARAEPEFPENPRDKRKLRETSL